ncbi:GNAT family N-acetyltransferase [Aestuariivirga sp.]|uniref:GNAT family N-acetyltransferase n=1 Tax=Aestuariivirga sp. TaxID=2650926 RepID=UPI0039E6A444
MERFDGAADFRGGQFVLIDGVTIRPARPGDGSALQELVKSLAISHGYEKEFFGTPELYETALFCPNPVIGAFLAEVSGTPAGCAIWHRSFSTFRGKEIIYLEDLSVLPDFRRRGIAKALLKAVAQLAAARDIPEVFWLMMDWNDGARALYESVGAEIEGGNSFCRLSGDALARLAQ